MEGYMKEGCKVISLRDFYSNNVIRTGIWMLFILILINILLAGPLHAEEKGNVAVLPFRINSLEPIGHLSEGLQQMFTSRMAEKGYFMISPDVVNKHPLAFLPSLEKKDYISIGRDIKADWIIHGSLTQIGERISLDIYTVDIKGTRLPFSLFMVEDSIDRLTDAVARATTSIDNQIAGVVQIEEIKITGNKRIGSDAISAAIESKKGDKFDQDMLDKDLRAIFRMGYFVNVNIEIEDGTRGKIVTFNVEEKPSIVEIQFNGNKKIKNDDLMEEIGIKRYSILNQSEVKQSVNRLVEFYRLKGYYNVKIKDTISELTNNEVTLTYEIEEGKKISITKIEFIGNTKFDDDDLKDVMETSEKGFFSCITDSGVLDMNKLEFDTQKIVNFYNNNGYIRAKTGEPKITYDEEKGITITIEIFEGEPYTTGSVEITGDLIMPADDLKNLLNINKQKYFSREVLINDIVMLRDLYADKGYAYTEVVPLTKENDEIHSVDIELKITKKKRVRFERISISGNTRTRDKVIRRELKAIEGEYYNRTNLKKSERNLYSLQFFQDVKITPSEGSRDDLMNLNVEVSEAQTDTFAMGVGYSSFDKTVGTIEVAFSNFRGMGQRLAGKASLGQRTTEYDISFTEPWLFDRRLRTTVNVFNWKTEYYTYTKDSLGGSLGFGFPLEDIDEYTIGSVEYLYDNAEILITSDNAASIIRDMEGKNVTSSLTLGVRRNSKDRPWRTTKGSLNTLTLEYAGGFLGGDSYFTKYTAKSAWYLPLKWETAFMIEGRLGYVTGRSGGNLPVYEKFTLGGINSVRGYNYGTISPIDPETGDRIGGEKMWLYKLEYRFPVRKDVGLDGILFFDSGNVFKKEDDFEFKAKSSVGAGIRWYSPVGPIRVEWGWKLHRGPGESPGEYEFSIAGTI